ncbi:MAG TPA: YdcF family protein, partial [Erythrobacter sp.]|nr:YdcF family protein [Erythrobacter sp.]
MILRLFSAIFLAWAFGFVWFFATLPAPAGDIKTDAVIVPTGAAGRIQRGLEVLDNGWADRMLVSGV